jgi:hypothetical protein
MMPILSISGATKPNRISTPEYAKDRNYHRDYARWILRDGLNTLQQEHIQRYQLNLEFYKNNQWIHGEDTEAFFKDDANMDNHRIKVIRNYIQPMVEQYRGNAIRMSYDVKASAISPLAKSRRDEQLARLLSYRDVADVIPQFGEYLKKKGFPIGQDVSETADRFNNVYVDQFVVALNRLIKSVRSANKLDNYKKDLAMDIALGGMGIMFPYPHGGEWRFRRVPVDRFGWDRGAVESDLSDSDYFYEYDEIMATAIYERFRDISYNDIRRIERLISKGTWVQSLTSGTNFLNGRMPVFLTYWRDCSVYNYGYVMDPYGQQVLERIDHVWEGEDKPRYTYADVIPATKLTPYQQRVLKGESVYPLHVDMWRYARIIPKEILGGDSENNQVADDIILESGIVPYQEPNLHQATNMLPPYKVGTWSYLKGEILSPVDVVINPQRMINRFLSVMEQQITSAGGSGPVYDKDMVDGDEDDFRMRMKRGEPVGVSGRGKGIQNVVGNYSAGIKESTLVFANLVENYKSGIEQMTGVNEALKGSANNPDQLVGVMQLAIQRGSLIQEPFYSALLEIYHGCVQNIATSAKRYYIDNEIDIADIVGDTSAEVLKLSKDMKLETFRTELRRTIDPDQERLYVDNQLIPQWIQLGLIDQATASNLIGRASMDEAVMEMRAFQKTLVERQRKAEAAQEEQMAAAEQTQNTANMGALQEKRYQEGREDQNSQMERGTKLAQTLIQSGQQKPAQ